MADILGALTNYAETELIEHIFHASNTYTPTAVYVGFHKANPTDAALANEISTAEYVNYTRSPITFAAPSSRAVTGGAVTGFPQSGNGATGATVTHYGVWDSQAAGSGNLLAYGELVSSKVISEGNTPSIDAGEIVLTFTAAGAASNYLATSLLNLMFRNTSWSKPSKYVFFAITTELTQASTGSSITEPSGNGYAREQVTGWTTSTNTANNTGSITLGPPTGSWGALVATGTVTAATGGEILFLDNAPGGDGQNPGNGDTVVFDATTYSVSLD